MADRLVWTSADGSLSYDFTDDMAGFTVLPDGTRGLRSVAYEMTTATYAGIDGETVQAVRAVAGSPTVGVLLQANGLPDYRSKVRALVHAMRPKAGIGTLTASTEDGESRSLPCYCTGGLEGDESPDVSLPGRWWKLALKFYAPGPWWLGEPQTLQFGLGAGVPFFPIFPLVLSPSTVQGHFTVDLSDADDGAFPVWTITGPGSGLVLTNNTTNRSLTVNASLASGEAMVIDTRPDYQSVRRGDGTNLLGAVDGYPDLWPLISDVNDVTADLVGATANSQIQGAWQPRYSGI